MKNWIATGYKQWAGKPLGGFEQHNKIIGGILEAAGIKGFLTNRAVMQDIGRVETAEDRLLDAMIEVIHAERGGAHNKPRKIVFRIFGTEAPPQTTKTDGVVQDAKYKGAKVQAIRDLLHINGIALPNSGRIVTDEGKVVYPDSAKSALGARIGGMVGAVRERTPDRVGEGEAWKVGRYILQKAGQDKFGMLYELKQETLDPKQGSEEAPSLCEGA